MPSKQARTGISRSILVQLEGGPLSIYEIMSKLGPRREGVTHSTIWITLDRARLNGLIRREKREGRGRTYFYSLTDGGQRRVAWIKDGKAARRPKAVANPDLEKEGKEG